MKIIEAGKIRVLCRTRTYDGMMAGIGILDGIPVSLDAGNHPGGWVLHPKWRQLERLMKELLDDGDFRSYLSVLMEKYEDQRVVCEPRQFEVRQLSNHQFEKLMSRHRQFQLHVGMNCDFEYDEEGYLRYAYDKVWGTSQEYTKAHYYNVVRSLEEEEEAASEILGIVSAEDLYEKSQNPPFSLKDPRSEELKQYQQTWKPGDPVRLDW